MLERNQHLYKYQYAFLLILSCLCNLFMVSVLEGQAGTGAWTAYLFSLPIGLALNALAAFLFSRNPGCSLHEINTAAFGSIGGKIVSLIYVLYFFLITCILLNYYGLYTVDTVLHQVKLGLFIAPIVFAVVYVARKGIEVIGRAGVILGVVLLAGCLGSAITELVSGNLENLFPLISASPRQLLYATFALSAIQFGELFAILTFIPDLVTRKRVVRTTLWSVLIGNGVVVLFAIGSVMVMGQTTYMNFAGFYRVIRSSDFAGILNSMKILVVAVYFFAAVFRLTVNLRAICKCLKDIFLLPASKHLALPVGALMIGFSQVISYSSTIIGQFLFYYYPYLATVPQLFLPLLTLIVLEIKRRRVKCS